MGGQVRSVEVQRLDLVNDTTIVDVRFRAPRQTPAELEPETSDLSRLSNDDVPASKLATEPVAGAPAAPTTQSWAGTRLSTVQTTAPADRAEAQPVTIKPAAQYVTRSAAQSSSQPATQAVMAAR